MRLKIVKISILTIILAIFAGCKSDTFKIEGTIKDMGTQNIRVIYHTGEDIRSNWIPIIDGKFTIEGASPELTVVEIFNQQKRLITHVAVKNGDKLEIKGDLKEPYKLEITGNDLNEEWNEFIRKHSDVIKKGNNTMVDLEIEKFIRTNPGNMVSTLLLMYDYSNLADTKIVDKLITTIEEPARPDYLIKAYKGLSSELSIVNDKKKITSFLLYSTADSIEGFNPSLGNLSLIYFWLEDNPERKAVIGKMKKLKTKYPKSKLQISDITLENDSAIWKKAIKTDSVSWKQFWALGGRMNNAVLSMGVKGAPYIIVADSVGTALYRGNSIDEASKKIDTKLKEPTKTVAKKKKK